MGRSEETIVKTSRIKLDTKTSEAKQIVRLFIALKQYLNELHLFVILFKI